MARTALILLAHGARDPEWALPLRRVCAQVRAQAPQLRAELAFLDFLSPNLHESAAALATEGFERIVVLPMFIAAGGHLKRDVPLLLEELRGLYPRISFEQAAALGDADAMIQAMVAHVLALAGE